MNTYVYRCIAAKNVTLTVKASTRPNADTILALLVDNPKAWVLVLSKTNDKNNIRLIGKNEKRD